MRRDVGQLKLFSANCPTTRTGLPALGNCPRDRLIGIRLAATARDLHLAQTRLDKPNAWTISHQFPVFIPAAAGLFPEKTAIDFRQLLPHQPFGRTQSELLFADALDRLTRRKDDVGHFELVKQGGRVTGQLQPGCFDNTADAFDLHCAVSRKDTTLSEGFRMRPSCAASASKACFFSSKYSCLS